MTDRELFEQLLVFVCAWDENQRPMIIDALRVRLAQREPTLVRPKQFIRMTLYEEDRRGMPLVMSVWPTPEDV